MPHIPATGATGAPGPCVASFLEANHAIRTVSPHEIYNYHTK
jgi:hypothetical protein